MGSPSVKRGRGLKVRREIVEPDPGALIESLRAFGYSLRTAIADLVDNSISAGAKDIHLGFAWHGAGSFILLTDDGNGMTDAALRAAMRLGSRSPVDTRATGDLGRFGLGLKTASFSQCRRLTVASRARGSKQVVRRWDLDHVVKTRRWELLPGVAAGSEDRVPDLAQGTCVLWECMDRVVPAGSKPADERRQDRFWEMADEVKLHLRIVFHRYLGDPRGPRIHLNGNLLTPWDPFLESHGATQKVGEETLSLGGSPVVVRAFVLPHQSKMSEADREDAAGPRGWAGQQGFYVYRGGRLLVAGDWLGLGFLKEDHHRLARIQVDIPNSMDDAWAIDVRKSRAAPPVALREPLQRLARITRTRAANVFRHRGKLIGKRSEQIDLWQRRVKDNRISFTVNRAHPLVTASQGEGRTSVELLLRLLEETVPAQTIVIDNSERPDCVARPFEGVDVAAVTLLMRGVYASLRDSLKLDAETARRRVADMDPFNAFPELLARLSDD
jgi:Histidine kinase-, DNA gyrase B-, and HSP90-like ATPase